MNKYLVVSVSSLCMLLIAVFTSPAYGVGPYSSTANTVLDSGTGLEWQRADDGQTRDWANALGYCESLPLGGHDDWRLPNLRELDSIVDFTQYNPAINQNYFSCQSSGYWSATTYPYYTYSTTRPHYRRYAWGIGFYHGGDVSLGKIDSWYVRCVRAGLSGSFGQFGSFAFDPIAGQQVGVAFPVTLKALTSNGTVKTDFNGSVDLSGSAGRISPGSVRLVAGQATFQATVYDWGTTQLQAQQGAAMSGNSAGFAVSGIGSCQADITGTVVDLDFNMVDGAVVKISAGDGTPIVDDQTTDQNGFFKFDNYSCDQYELSIKKDPAQEKSEKVRIKNNNQNVYRYFELAMTDGTADTPVILVPGMLGSGKKLSGLSIYPKLSWKTGKHNLNIHAPRHTGFHQLKKELKDDKDSPYKSFKVFECPWDWRMPIEEAAKEYLEPMIDEALKLSTSGKVHIVAHSMGGLVVRHLIQNSSTYAGKIDKFAMVGTPNLGSSNAYYIWEGGDPKLIDDIGNEGKKVKFNFYTGSIRKLWLITYNKKLWKNSEHKEIRKFVQKKAPSLLELMATGNFLLSKRGSEGTTGSNENTALKTLNISSPGSRMSAYGSNGTVQTGLFVGSQKDTVVGIKVAANFTYYADGAPANDKKKTWKKGAGDGTVPLDSALWPQKDGWAALIANDSPNDHGTLVKGYVDEIKHFLITGAKMAPKSAMGLRKEKAADDMPPMLSFSVNGTVRLDITGPQGGHCGFDQVTGDLQETLSGCTLAFEGDSGEVGVESPGNGIYNVVIFGAENRDYQLDIAYQDGTITENNPFKGYYESSQISFDVVVNNSTEPRISITPPAISPENLVADIVNSGAGTSLSWDASTEAGVTGYNIYSIGETGVWFTQIASVAVGVTSHSTTDPWAGDETTPVMTYAVTAVKSDGSESYFSNRVQNNDRDHDFLIDVEEADYGTDPAKPDTDNDGYTDYEEIYAGSDPLDRASIPTEWRSFAWPMFLPAITGGGRN